MFMNMPSDHRFVSSVDGHVAETIELLAEQRESHNNVHEDLWLWVKSGGFSIWGKHCVCHTREITRSVSSIVHGERFERFARIRAIRKTSDKREGSVIPAT
jgi:hypothetical protein